MKNVAGSTVICDKIDGTTVTLNFIRPPQGMYGLNDSDLSEYYGVIHKGFPVQAERKERKKAIGGLRTKT